MTELLLLNGPNLGILGRREPEIYGTDTLADIEESVAREVAGRGWKVVSVQRESEGELIQAVQDAYDTVGAIINPGALMIAEAGGHSEDLDGGPLNLGVGLANVLASNGRIHTGLAELVRAAERSP